MSESTDSKHEMVLSAPDAAAFLRRLADQLEAGGLQVGQVMVETDGEVKIKQSIKTKEDKAAFKLKLKYETPMTPHAVRTVEGAAPPTTNLGKPSYKSLKKRMGKSFGQIKKAIESGQMPEYALLRGFIADANLMVTYPDKGEEHYPDFKQAASLMSQAAEEDSLEDLAEAWKQMNAMKKSCHDQYK